MDSAGSVDNIDMRNSFNPVVIIFLLFDNVCSEMFSSIILVDVRVTVHDQRYHPYVSPCTPTNHSHVQPRLIPNFVNYFLRNVYVKYKNTILSHTGFSFRTRKDKIHGHIRS